MLDCIIYLAALGVVSFIAGRMWPKSWLHENSFPFRSMDFEKQGKIYEKIKIKEWQNKLPDMSRILPAFIPAKKMDADKLELLPLMIKETCVAELIHVLLPVAGLMCIGLWPGPGGIAVSIIYFLGNLPFVFIQRYNRPRLMRLNELRERTRKRGI